MIKIPMSIRLFFAMGLVFALKSSGHAAFTPLATSTTTVGYSATNGSTITVNVGVSINPGTAANFQLAPFSTSNGTLLAAPSSTGYLINGYAYNPNDLTESAACSVRVQNLTSTNKIRMEAWRPIRTGRLKCAVHVK